MLQVKSPQIDGEDKNKLDLYGVIVVTLISYFFLFRLKVYLRVQLYGIPDRKINNLTV
jgi:hypothetical protein